MRSDDDYNLIADLVKESEVPYGQEYISLLARRVVIDAYKEGRKRLTRKSVILAHWQSINR
ncbi:MAG: hypothetical protein WAT79_09880 [Saprospiraceae bacterium]